MSVIDDLLSAFADRIATEFNALRGATNTSLTNRVRHDTPAQGLTTEQKGNARANIDAPSTADVGNLTLLETAETASLVGAVNSLKSDTDTSLDTLATGLSATDAAVATKEPALTASDSTKFYRGDKTWQTLNKSAVGLGSVDNTADSAKPVSTAQQSALDNRVRHDTASQGLGSTAQANARANIDAPGRTDLPVSAMDPAYSLSGTTDNTTAMQAALDAAATAGRNIHFPMRALGQPYMLGGTGFLLKVAAGVRISADPGVVFKVKNSNGNYKAMLAGTLSSTDLSGLVVQGVTFDQNTSGNAVSDVATLLVDGTQRFCVFAGVGSGITIRDCVFQNIDGLNTLYLGGAAMKDVRIQNCEFDLVGTSPAWHDHSTIYTSCDGSTIQGNRFRGVSGGLGATTAIETHGPNQTVQGNRVESYKIGANITGITSLGNDLVQVKDNNFRNVLIGIQLWSWAGTNGGLVDVAIEGNLILINRDPWHVGSSDFARGICMSQSASGGNSVTHIEGLRIVGNVIRYKSFTDSLTNDYQNSSGIELVSQDSSVELRDLVISDNLVVNAIGVALRVGCKIRRGKIHDNSWVDPSTTTEASVSNSWRSAIVMTGNADLYDVKMWGNRTVDTRGTHKLVQGWLTSLSTGTTTRCEEWDNTVVCNDGTILPENSQTTNKKFAARGVAAGPRYKTGMYQTAQGGVPSSSNLTLADGQEYCIPFPLSAAQAFVEMNCNVVTVGGTAGTVLRYGIRLDDGTGSPGALLADLGTVVADSGTGAKPKAITQTVPAGWAWLTVTAQGSNVVISGITGWLVGSSGSTSIAAAIQARSTYYQTGVTGALPSTFTSGGQSAIGPAIFLKA